MKDEYIIINKTALQKIREELNKGSAHWDGIYISDYQQGQIDLIDEIILSQSTPLTPIIETSIEKGYNFAKENLYKADNTLQPKIKEYIANLKFFI
ncbi:hypothetical protein [Leptolyngbya phage Lbo-JY46]